MNEQKALERLAEIKRSILEHRKAEITMQDIETLNLSSKSIMLQLPINTNEKGSCAVCGFDGIIDQYEFCPICGQRLGRGEI